MTNTPEDIKKIHPDSHPLPAGECRKEGDRTAFAKNDSTVFALIRSVATFFLMEVFLLEQIFTLSKISKGPLNLL